MQRQQPRVTCPILLGHYLELHCFSYEKGSSSGLDNKRRNASLQNTHYDGRSQSFTRGENTRPQGLKRGCSLKGQTRAVQSNAELAIHHKEVILPNQKLRAALGQLKQFDMQTLICARGFNDSLFQLCLLQRYNAVFIHSQHQPGPHRESMCGPFAAVCFQNSVTPMERGCNAEQHTTLFRP